MEKGFRYAKLTFDEPRAIYYSGQVLSGHIECELSQTLNYIAINVTFRGEANVHWTEWETEEYNGVERRIEVTYEGTESYFNYTQCVSGGRGLAQLQPGTHSIPFQFQIPYNAPSSFSGERGSVFYTVLASIQYADPGMESDELEKEFEVVAALDLNKGSEDIKHPIEIEFEEMYSCCCSSSPMNIKVKVPASGYCPAQAIPITVNAQNDSSVEVKKIIFQLIQKECYHSLQPLSDYIPPEKVLETVTTGAVLANTHREFTYELVVPDMIAPNLENCNIIDVGFFFKVMVKLSGCNDDVEDESEICIGLVPLSNPNEPYTHPMASDLPNAPIPAGNTNNTAVPHLNALPNTATSYPNSNAAYPNSVSPYANPLPYLHSNVNYPNTTAPFPNSNVPYPNSNAPYPNSNAPYLNSNAPQPNSNIPHPNSNVPYPNSTASTVSTGQHPGYPSKEHIPLMNLPNEKIGFVMPASPPLANQYPVPSNPPYPAGNYMSSDQNSAYAPPPPYPTFGAPSAPPPS